MCGCWSRAASWISRRKRSGPSAAAELGVEHLERDRAVVPEVLGEVDRGHAAAAELALERVAALQRFTEWRERIQHCLWLSWVAAGGYGG